MGTEETAVEEQISGPQEGSALCLSGGGYRAMLFHVGALWRLHELGLLSKLKRISSVSGGSITASVLALAWKRLDFAGQKPKVDFEPLVAEPIREMARQTVDRKAILTGIFLPGTIGERVAAAYDRYLLNGATLQDLPDDADGLAPRFIFNATSVQSGALWRFSRPYMGDWRVGRIYRPTLPLALAVAASSAFPPFLSPLKIDLDPQQVRPDDGSDLSGEPYTSRAFLTDGGVYDNLGLETVWKNYQTVFVSDGGAQMAADTKPRSDWPRHAYRILNVVDNQVRALRKRQLVGSYDGKQRTGAYWGIRSDIKKFPVTSPLECPRERTLPLSQVATRLKSMPDEP